MDKIKSPNSEQKNNHTKQKNRRRLSIAEKVALIGGSIGLIGTVFTVLIGPIIQCRLQPYTCAPPTPTPALTFTITLQPPTLTSTPTLTPTPIISILNVQSAASEPIDKNYAPYKVLVSGNISNAKGLHLYLIVDDTNKKWIQNPYGIITGDTFTAPCYLGSRPDDPIAQNKTYIIYAVVTNNGSYKEGDGFTGEGLIVKSNEIVLIRRELLTATPVSTP